MTDRRLKLFPRDEAGNIIRRPLYAHFLLRASRTERGMKILFQPAMLNGALRELPVYCLRCGELVGEQDALYAFENQRGAGCPAAGYAGVMRLSGEFV